MEYFKRWDGFTGEEAAELLTIFKRRWGTAERHFGRMDGFKKGVQISIVLLGSEWIRCAI